MRRPFALFFLTFLLAASQDDLPTPLPSPTPDTLTEPDEDPISDLLKNSSQAPFTELPSGVEIYGKTIRLDGSLNQGNQKASDTIVRYIGDIQLNTDTGLKAYADLAVTNFSKKTVQLSGNVSLYQDGLVYRGESSVFNLETKSFETKDLRLGFSPIMLKAKSIRQITSDGRKVFVAEDAGITTHDTEDPAFWLQSKRATIFPDDKIIFKDFNLRIGNRNLLWLPYLAQPFDANRGYLIAPGGQTNLGAFVKNRYGIMLGGESDLETGEKKGAWLLSQWHADLYSNKGLGMGVDLFDTRLESKDGYGWLKIYHIDDLNPEDERAGVDRTNIKPNRFRAEFVHRIPFLETQDSRYSFDANLTLLSDQYYLEDFDPSLFRINRAPDNFLGFTKRSPNSLTQLGTRLRLNDFYQSDTRLPEFTHDWIRQPFLDTPLLYESQTLLGIYQERLAKFQRDSLQSEADALLAGDPRFDQISRLLDDRGFTRFHTYHEFSLPIKAGHLNVVPRFGAGHTNYQAVQGPDDSIGRTHVSANIDVSTKFNKLLPNFKSDKWGIDGARHIIEPYSSLSWLSTNDLDSSFGRIDRLTPTSRPRQRQVGRFTAVDDLQDWSILRLGMRNRLVTRRDSGMHDWLTMDTYFDAFIEDPELDRDFSNLYNDIRWNPVPWLELDLETQFPVSTTDNFTEIASSMRLMPDDDFEFKVGYRHLNNHPVLRDSDRILLETFTRLNDYWGIGTHHRLELVDSTLELQQYNIHYDFDSFVGSAGFFIRNNRSQDEHGIMFNFGIKEIPSLSLPIKIGAQ